MNPEVVEVLVYRLRKRLEGSAVRSARCAGWATCWTARAMSHRAGTGSGCGAPSCWCCPRPGDRAAGRASCGSPGARWWTPPTPPTTARCSARIKSIDANISTASGGLSVELPYRMLGVLPAHRQRAGLLPRLHRRRAGGDRQRRPAGAAQPLATGVPRFENTHYFGDAGAHGQPMRACWTGPWRGRCGRTAW